jgi:hypothetical protein
MYYIIDACEYCDEFKRVSFEDINDKGEFVTICEDCAKMFSENTPIVAKEPIKKHKWRFVKEK